MSKVLAGDRELWQAGNVPHPTMKHSFRLAGLALAAAAVTVAAVTKPTNRLTPKRIAEVNALSNATDAAHISVQLSGFPKIGTTTDGHRSVLESIQELRYPTEFDPPDAPKAALAGKAPGGGVFPITPTTPRAFETLNVGWTIALTTKARGGIVDLYGEANFVEADLVNAGYGALAGPIFSDDGILITPNRVQMPKSSTTTTRFHLFAVPGESYDVTLYRGSKAEKHTVTITAE
jgi:hypothetical protein